MLPKTLISNKLENTPVKTIPPATWLIPIIWLKLNYQRRKNKQRRKGEKNEGKIKKGAFYKKKYQKPAEKKCF